MFGPAQNILGPVKGQGMSLQTIWQMRLTQARTEVRRKVMCD